MNPDDLREQLAKLHEELSAVQEIGPRSVRLLSEIMSDIKRLTEPEVRISLPERLEKIAVQFEAQHPTLAESSRRLVCLGMIFSNIPCKSRSTCSMPTPAAL